MILKVFQRVGERYSIASAFQQLCSLSPSNPYQRYRAAGSLGGAVNGGTLKLVDGYYERIR